MPEPTRAKCGWESNREAFHAAGITFYFWESNTLTANGSRRARKVKCLRWKHSERRTHL